MTARFGKPRSWTHRRGYVLMLVLAVSVLVITALSGLAKVSLRRGLQAADAQRSLQQRWGARTLRKAALNQAPKIFEQREAVAAEQDRRLPPAPSLRAAITFGGVTYDLLLADEDAKLNLNSLYHHAGPLKTQQAIRDIVGPGASSVIKFTPAGPPLMLTTSARRVSDREDQSTEEIPDAFRSWGEVFDLAKLQQQLADEAGLPNVTTDITCWGSGQLNFRRASDEAILAVVGSVVQDGGAQRLLQRYRRNPLIALGVLLRTEVKDQRDRDRLSDLLSESSTNFSLWVHASTPHQRSLQRLVVMNRDDEGVTHFHEFTH